MKRLAVSLLAVMITAAMPVQPAFFGRGIAVAAEAGPEDILRALYAEYGPDSTPQNPYDAYFSPDLLELWNAVDEGSKGDVEYAIDFDIFIDAQDFDTVSDLKMKTTKPGPDKAHVDATFTAFGESHAMTYEFVATGAGWKIDNMGWGADRMDLRSMLVDFKKQQRKSR